MSEGTGPARVALVGAHGFGEIHRRNLARLAGLGRARLVAVAEPAPFAPGELAADVHVHADLDALLAAERDLDVVIVSTPLHTHLELAERVLASGADLYLEKPPVTSLAQFERLSAAAAAAGRLVQVGFQSLGSHAVPWLRSALADGAFGDVRAVTAAGVWSRSHGYFTRSRWAGRRTLDGIDVVDGVATNAFAHAVITAMTVAGAQDPGVVDWIDVDLHRANPVESDDTTVVRLRRPAPQPDVTCALTLCGPDNEAEPFVTIHGSEATATFSYVIDEVRIVDAHGGDRVERFGRTDLLENLLDAREHGAELLCALGDTEGYMAVLEAIRTAAEPHPIPERFVESVGWGADERIVIPGVAEAIARACAAEATFTELGLPWAVDGRDGAEPAGAAFAVGEDAGRDAVAVLRTGEALAASLSPRPYLHPVRTRAGAVLTDAFPLDHPWHLGAGVAMPSVRVDGPAANLWGGPDYRPSAGGYRWGRTHGRIRILAGENAPGTVRERLEWLGADGSPLVHESRTWTWEAIDGDTWRLGLRFELHAAGGPVTLDSPGSLGRPDAGYGGFFWRFAPSADVDVRTRDAQGESAVNGVRAPWLLWTSVLDGARRSVLFGAPSEADDPWFVRVAEYPGVGSALAWDAPLRIGPGAPVTRTLAVVVSDRELTVGDARLLTASAS
ncbi:DUF6807 family protein [Leifsonia sp. NPDC080035]|uniref:DUF6807 family protein n=1 Tax=Leifsonia sp. NPDC080035 TaxID=3143936 RepID=A0AAU7GEY2_9MICO